MRTSLHPDPSSRSPGVEAVEVSVERPAADLLTLRYTVTGDLSAILIPPPAPSERTDGLWQATCFELFVRREGEEAYREFNFAPSGAWAAYAFSAYREGMAEAPLPAPPEIRTAAAPGRLDVEVTLRLPLEYGPHALNLAVILQDRAGERSFWAAKHPVGEPDFHDPGCFIHALPAALAP